MNDREADELINGMAVLFAHSTGTRGRLVHGVRVHVLSGVTDSDPKVRP